MELTVEELQKKALGLRRENVDFAQQVQKEINSLQQQLQSKAREAQRLVDLKDGKVKALEDLIREMGGTPKDEGGNTVPEQPNAPTS